jgi:CheY-like chemotaxis protein
MTEARILIVEDDMVIAMDLQTTLEDMGYEVTSVVASGEECLQELVGSDVDAVLMDIRLAGALDGIETAKLVGQQFKTPVVFVTAATDPELDRLKGAIGPYNHISKPFREEQLRVAIDKALKKGQK